MNMLKVKDSRVQARVGEEMIGNNNGVRVEGFAEEFQL